MPASTTKIGCLGLDWANSVAVGRKQNLVYKPRSIRVTKLILQWNWVVILYICIFNYFIFLWFQWLLFSWDQWRLYHERQEEVLKFCEKFDTRLLSVRPNCFAYLGEDLTPWAVQLIGYAFRIVLWCALSLHLHDVNTSVPMSLTNGLARKLIDVRFSDSVLFKPLQLANQHNLKLILNSWVIGRNRITLSTPCCSSWAFASNWDAPWSSLGFEGRQSKSHHRLLGEVPWLSRLSVLWSKKTRWR